MNDRGLVLRRIAAAAGITTVVAYAIAVSWLRWGDLVIDTGRELYVPAALLQGKVLYRDLFYLYGPLSPYCNAAFYRLFGVHVWTVAAGGFAAAAGVGALVYALARVYLGPGLSVLTLGCFVLIFPFGCYNDAPLFNYAIPYSYPAVHSLLLALAAIYSLHRHLSRGGRRYRALAALCLFLALLTKAEVAAWLAVAVGAGLFLEGRRRGCSRAAALGSTLSALAPPVVAAGLVLAVFALRADWRLLVANVSENALPNLLLRPDTVAGFLFADGDPAAGAGMLALKTAQLAGVVAVAVLGGRVWERSGRLAEPAWRIGARVLAAASACAGALSLVALPSGAVSEHAFRAVPLLCVVAATLALGGFWRGCRDEERITLAVLALFAGSLLLRVALHATAMSMGFVLLVPGFLVFQILLLRVVPDILHHRAAAAFVRGALAVAGAAIALAHAVEARQVYAGVDTSLATPRGTLRFRSPERVAAYRELIADLRDGADPGRTLVAFPEGLTVNFFAELENPLYYYQYLPVDLPDERAVARLIAQLEHSRPTYFLLTDRDVREYGAPSVQSYAAGVRRYVEARYRLKKVYGNRLALYERSS